MKSPLHYPKTRIRPSNTIANAYTLIAVVYCSCFSVVFYVVVEHLFLSVVHFLAFISVVVNYIMLKRTCNFDRATNIILATGTSVVIALFATGGWEGTGYLWPFAYLPFAFFLARGSGVIKWVIVLITGCAAVVLLHVIDVINIPYSPVAIFNYFAAMTVFVSCIFLYQKATVNYEEFLAYARNLMELSPDPFIIIDENGKISDANEITERYTNTKIDELIGSDFSAYFIDPVKAQEFCQQTFEKGSITNFLLSMKKSDGSTFELLINAVLYLEKKSSIKIFAIARDTTEQIRTEKSLKLKTDELVRSNQELEQFAYIASHDLQEPLRTISNFTDIIEEEYGHKLEEEAREYLKFILMGAAKMRNLIKGLLDYSRIGKATAEGKVDCNLVVQTILAEMETVIKETNAQIHIDTLPIVYNNESRMKQLFENLISNAIKFRKKDQKPEIFVGVEERENDYLFSVKDNGIGIKEQYWERIFVVFQRLHTTAEYPGIGLGLATCKKIVAMSHGKIWVESKDEEGSVFYFTLNKNYD